MVYWTVVPKCIYTQRWSHALLFLGELAKGEGCTVSPPSLNLPLNQARRELVTISRQHVFVDQYRPQIFRQRYQLMHDIHLYWTRGAPIQFQYYISCSSRSICDVLKKDREPTRCPVGIDDSVVNILVSSSNRVTKTAIRP